MRRIHNILLVVTVVLVLPDYTGIKARSLPSHTQKQSNTNVADLKSATETQARPTAATLSTKYVPLFMTLKPNTTKLPSTTKAPRTTTKTPRTTTKSQRTTKKQQKEDEKKEEKKQNEKQQQQETQGGEESATPGDPPINPGVIAAGSVAGVAAAAVVGAVVAKKLIKKKKEKKEFDPKCVYIYDKDTEGHTHDDRYKPATDKEGASTSGETTPLLPTGK